ncbi:hypothetical protein [Desulfatibacillum aliphaticivorans]|uniref:hypothetical protein n=1 Tax=Desulfatibacillum aliphaticivorans TaxID=218208 RepID=UPI00040BC7A6|nr:hypothetical protein [Desulfatibacillum aliphaticivorans]
MSEKIRALKEKLKDLEARVKEREASLPAHSVRVSQIMELEELEEERDQIRRELEELLAEKK